MVGSLCLENNDNIYSTGEKKIGTWTDGKTIYRKCVYFGQLPNSSRKTVEHRIENLSRVINYNCWFYSTTGVHITFKNYGINPSLSSNNLIYSHITTYLISITTQGTSDTYYGWVILDYTKA